MQKLAKSLQKNRNYLIGLLGTLALASELVPKFLPEKTSPVRKRILHAKRDIHVGEYFSMNDFYLREIEEKKVNPLEVSDQKLSWLSGARFEEPLDKDEALDFKKLLLSPSQGGYAKWTPKGYRAFSVTFENLIRVRPGDHIDLYEEKKGTHSLLIENLTVLEGNSTDRPRNAVLIVSPQDIARLKGHSGNWNIVVRNPEDKLLQATSQRVQVWQD